MRVHRILLLAVALLLAAPLVSMLETPLADAQVASSADEAVRQKVAETYGVEPATLITRFIAESGDWAYGSATIPATTEDGAPAVFYLLAHQDGANWIAELRYTAAFDKLLRQAPADFPNASVRAALDGVSLAGDGSSQLSFPFPVGQTWRFNGPHPNSSSPVWSSLDFYLPNASNGFVTGAPVVAMRGGVVDRPCDNMVVIDHGDGWSTYYYHVTSIIVATGQTVTRGQQLGGTSDQYNCGGWADGPHVHVWTTYQGAEKAIEGIDIGGWTVQKGIRAYDGCFYRGTVVLCAQYYDSITNEGVVGSVGNVSISPTRTTVNNWITYNVEPFPPNTSGEVIWRRLSGSLITVDTFTTDDAGVASGRFRVPATPGGPNQLISFIAGDTTRTALFEVAPRIKVLTDPAVRGQQVNVSLRGYDKKEQVRIRWRHPDGHWVELAQITTSNTGSSNTWVTVPFWAADGSNSVRGDGTEFRQQTNVVNVSGGPFQLADESIQVDVATPEAEVALPVQETSTPTETPIEIDRSALPLDQPLVSQADPIWTIDPNTGTVVTTVDLSSPHTVTTIGWLVLSDQCAPIDRIETSLDAIAWTPVELAGSTVPGVWAVVAPGVDARWIRWVSTATDPADAIGCLADIAVWAIPVTPEPVLTPTLEPTETIPDETGTPVPASSD